MGILLHISIKVREAIELPFKVVSGVDQIGVLNGGQHPLGRRVGLGGFWSTGFNPLMTGIR